MERSYRVTQSLGLDYSRLIKQMILSIFCGIGMEYRRNCS